MPRLPDGALELEVLAVLRRASGPLTPADVRRHIAHDLAYTTVMTVLGRLHAKGLADRALVGRAFGHTAAVSESELTARKMGTVLATADDRAGALSGFVTHLSAADIAGCGRAEARPNLTREQIEALLGAGDRLSAVRFDPTPEQLAAIARLSLARVTELSAAASRSADPGESLTADEQLAFDASRSAVEAFPGVAWSPLAD